MLLPCRSPCSEGEAESRDSGEEVMAERTEVRRLTGHLTPIPFLAGFGCAFLGCCLLGWIVSRAPFVNPSSGNLR